MGFPDERLHAVNVGLMGLTYYIFYLDHVCYTYCTYKTLCMFIMVGRVLFVSCWVCIYC